MYEANMAEKRGCVKTFSDSGDVLEALEESLSPERLSTYLIATQGDRERAVRLYTWNTAVSGAFYGPLQTLEVTLRNAMHIRLVARYGLAWYDNPDARLDSGCLERVATAKADLASSGHAAEPPRMVAALSFGFWVSLLGPGGRIHGSGRKANYEMTLWRPALRRAFSHRRPLTRRQAHGPLNHLRTLRNRIAHHEPIFMRHLRKDHERILDITGWISPGTRVWIERHSRVPDLLDMPRDAVGIRF